MHCHLELKHLGLNSSRLGELIVDSVNSFDSSKHILCGVPLCCRELPNKIPFIIIHVLWTKTTHSDGTDIVASKINNFMNPVSALEHHLSANAAIPPSTPFFAYKIANRGWIPMMRPWFLAHCNKVWRDAMMPELMGHCFHISGASTWYPS